MSPSRNFPPLFVFGSLIYQKSPSITVRETHLVFTGIHFFYIPMYQVQDLPSSNLRVSHPPDPILGRLPKYPHSYLIFMEP